MFHYTVDTYFTQYYIINNYTHVQIITLGPPQENSH